MAAERITVTRTGSAPFFELVHYLGTRESLLAAQLATADMFPPPGERRRFAHVIKFAPDYFALTAKGDAWLLTRWRHWRHPDAEAMSDALYAQYLARGWRGERAA